MCITKTKNKKVVKHKDVYPIFKLGILPNPEIVKKTTPGPKNYVFCQKLDHMTIICHRTCKTIGTYSSFSMQSFGLRPCYVAKDH